MRRTLITSILLLFVACGSEGDSNTSSSDRREWNVVLVSIDTLRADRLSTYGYERQTTPNIDALAARSLVFENAIAESSWTTPSHMSMLTGLYPTSHGVTLPRHRASEKTVLLAEILRDEGWRTYGFTDGGLMGPRAGFDRGFEIFEHERLGLAQCLMRTRQVLAEHDSDKPYFLFVQTYDVHCPYDPPDEYADLYVSPGREEIEVAGKCGNPYFNTQVEMTPAKALFLSDQYDAGLRWVDDTLQQLFDLLEQRGDLERTIVIVTSDHGEELLEHGHIGHERTLFKEVLSIPLIVFTPEVVPARSEIAVGLSDLVPTLLDVLGLEGPPDLDGKSFAPLLAATPAAMGRAPYRFSELDRHVDLVAFTSERHQLIWNATEQKAEYYDLEADPQLQHDLWPERADELRPELEALIAFQRELAANRREVEDAAPASNAHLEELRKLGYTGK